MCRISIDEVAALRQMRRKIVEICEYIYGQKWDLVGRYLQTLSLQLRTAIPEHTRCIGILNQCESCLQKGNYIRLRDLLVQEIDFYIANLLRALDERDRRLLSEEAGRENEEALGRYHKDILALIGDRTDSARIRCTYEGTENVSISIKEMDYEYRLFSNVNPWSESNNLVNSLVKREFEEILVLGFGGGYVVGELERKFSGTKIKVYLPNIDIFKAVIFHIAVSNIIQNENLEFYFDPTCLRFLISVHEMMGRDERVGFYVDRQELKACIGRDEIRQGLPQWRKAKQNTDDMIENKTVGEQIAEYINSLVI